MAPPRLPAQTHEGVAAGEKGGDGSVDVGWKEIAWAWDAAMGSAWKRRVWLWR